MGLFADLRTIPGLKGGGFGRVVDVQRLTGGRVSMSDAPQDALVRLERLSDPLQTFQQNVQQFLGDGKALAGSTPRLSGDMLTLLQQIDPARQDKAESSLPPLGPQLPPLGATPEHDTGPDTKNTTDNHEADAADRKARQALADTTGRLAASDNTEQPFGPDLIAQLDALLQRPPVTFRTSTLSYQDIGNISPDLSSTSAALAARTYAATLTGTTAPDSSLTA